ncbi:MAG: hypothetical protein IKH27_01305 [Oscillospiraceae bacterium]|nr:hypothetical protein [Oscillospiraceae bacterium]
MSKSILSKVAAVACSVASVIALGVCASAEKLEVNGTNYDLDTSKVNLVATKVELTLDELKAADYKVQYDVEVANNTGFAGCGVRLVYPSNAGLEVVPNSKGKPGTAGAVIKSMMPYVTDNPEEYNVSVGCSSMENGEDDGLFLTVDFKLPASTKAGDKIPMKLEVDRFLDDATHEVAYKVVDGYILIKDAGTTKAPETTTKAPETTTKAPETTTKAPETTTQPVVTSATTAPVSSTTKAPDTTVSAASSTTTAAPGTAGTKVTTSAKAGSTAGNKNTTKAGATQAGDTGAGVAVAALLLAAGTAVAAAKKKED